MYDHSLVNMEFSGGRLADDPYAGYVVDDSDLEYSDTCSDDGSSEDENYVQQQHQSTNIEEESEDEFEKEMNKEADKLLEIVMKRNTGDSQNKQGPTKPPGPVNTWQDKAKETDAAVTDDGEKFYNDIYFDSSEDEEEGATSKGGKKIVKLTNDELFYDPKMDEEDEKWVERQRRNYHKNVGNTPTQGAAIEANPGATPTPSGNTRSDAILNCPACMTTLCLDCQSHELYSNQFRAMFALNCKIVKDEVLRYRPKQTKRKRKSNQPTEDDGELYRPVRCTICDTEVAVYDKDEVFHFFNVIASAS